MSDDYKQVSATPAVGTGAHADGDVLGTVMTFSGALSNLLSGRVKGVVITDKGKQSPVCDLVLFNAAPGASVGADDAAFAPAAGDLAKIMGGVRFATTDWYVASANSFAYRGNIDIPVSTLTGDLYGVLVSRGTPTPASAADYVVTLLVSQEPL